MQYKTLLAWMILACLAFSYVSIPVRAEDADTDGDAHPDDNEDAATDEDASTDEADYYSSDSEEDIDVPLGPSPDVDTDVLFVGYPDRKLKIGREITLLMSLKNRGMSSFNIAGLGAHLHSAFEFNYYIQNFTAFRYTNVTLEPQQELSLEYRFTPDASLEPLEFWFSSWVRYNETGNEFHHTTYNHTIELVEAKGEVDATTFLTYVVGLAGVGVVLYIFAGANNSKSSTSVERGTRDDTVEIYTPSSKSRVRSSSRKKKKKKN